MTRSTNEAQPRPLKRSWLQFRLRTLLLAMVVLGAIPAWLETARRRHAEQFAACRWIEERGGKVKIRRHRTSRFFDRLGGRYAGLFDSVVEADLTRLSAPETPQPGKRVNLLAFMDLQRQIASAREIENSDLAPLRCLNELEWLNLGMSSATDEGLLHLEGLDQLRALHLSGVAVTDAGLSRLVDSHPKLTTLRLSNTQITGAGLPRLAALENLTWLDLHGCYQIKDDDLVPIGRMHNLEHLFLPADIGDEGFEHLQHLTNLRTIDAPDSEVRNVGLRYLRGMTKLEVLDLTRAKVGDEGLPHLAHLKNLRELALSSGYPTAITDDGLKHLAALTALERLELAHRSITDAGLEHLTGLKNLRALDLKHTDVTAAGAKALKAQLPRVIILLP